MKKLGILCWGAGLFTYLGTMSVQAADTVEESAKVVPAWMCIPFAGLLLCIAILPLICPEWWEKHQLHGVIILSLLFIIPYGIFAGAGQALEVTLECVINDYLTFIVLLFGLFCVSGNLSLEGDLAGSPRVNTAILFFGTLLASGIGTTGASMLLVRPVIQINSWRKRKSHVMIFFIFMISNMGGCLTPIGDPPLLMGFMRGVPFFWSFHLLPILLFNMIILLSIFYIIDNRNYRKDIAEGLKPDISKAGTGIKICGAHNIFFLLMIVAAVILSGIMPEMPLFLNQAGEVMAIRIFGNVEFTVPSLIEMIIILLAGFLSFKTTPKQVRTANHFSWGAIREVGVLFVGIFITMQPALMLLKKYGPELGITKPFQLFWATGALSSFLDNTPTYLVFLTTAGSLGTTGGIPTTLGHVTIAMLTAVSCGAVFMGANTYIGNAPNFMVKSISDENGVHMPSFFGYMLWSLAILIPVFLVDTVVFFL